MTKDVLLSIKGLQFANEQDTEPVEVITSGDYYKRNGKHYILYDEVMEGQEESTRNIIKVQNDYMELTKKGVVNVHMVFEKNKQNVTYYYTPYGGLQIGIDAERVSVDERDEEIQVEVLYGLDINNEHLANCRITLTAVPRGSRHFTLLS